MTARKTFAAFGVLWIAGAISLTALLAGVTPVNAQTAPQYYIYHMGAHDLSPDIAAEVGQGLALTLHTPPNPGPLDNVPSSNVLLFTGPVADGSTRTRMVYLGNSGRLTYFTDYSKNLGTAPAPAAAVSIAESFLAQHALLPAVQLPAVQSILPYVETTAAAGAQVNDAGGMTTSAPRNVLQTVTIPIFLDGLHLVGPTYKLSVDVSSHGVEGFSHEFRTITKASATPVTLITLDQATTLFNEAFAPELRALRDIDPKTSYKVILTNLIYYEQGLNYIQPVYHFQVQITSSDGNVHGRHFYIAAATNSPEVINHEPTTNFGEQSVTPAPVRTVIGAAAANPITDPDITHLAGLTKPTNASNHPLSDPKAGIYDPLPFGVYEVRDDNRFLNGANGFIGNLESSNWWANFMGAGYPQVVNTQYYWDYPWLWENDPADGVPDNSPWFVGAVNIALYEGHGAPWECTCYSNCCDLITYPNIPGYGKYRNSSEVTNYVLWHTCDSVPAPGDPYGGDYTSPHSPFDVWFTVFQGMRGTYGSRTTVDIYDNVEAEWAANAGYGASNLSNWLNSEANDATGHGGGWDYACCVIISGHESDCIYDTGQVSPPGSLTMYWQY